ncbi:MAG: hypothetical protein ABI237_05915 [Ginsengibacter sp.]
MSNEKFGIENLKKLVAFGVAFGASISADLADGKFTLSEGIALLPQLMAIPDLVASKDAIINEAKDLSIDEVNELVAGIEGVTSENVTGIISDALTFIVAGKNLVERFTNKPAAADPAAPVAPATPTA